MEALDTANCSEILTWIAFLSTISEDSEQDTHKEKYLLSTEVWELNRKFLGNNMTGSIITYNLEILYDNVVYKVRQRFLMFSPKIIKYSLMFQKVLEHIKMYFQHIFNFRSIGYT